MAELACKICKELVVAEDAVRCYSECKGAFHFSCAQVKEVQFRKRSTAEKQAWGCPECRQGRKANLSPGAAGITISDVHALVLSVSATLVSMQKEMKEIATSQKYLSDCYDDLENKLAAFGKVEKDVEVLKAKLDEKEKTIAELANRIAHQEQYSRRFHLEFANITPRPNEDLEEVVINMANHLNVKLSRDDIQVAHRLYSKDKRNPPVIVEFSSRKLRDNILSKRRQTIITNKNLLGAGYSEEKVYINESLSPYFKNLLWLARSECRNKNYKWCWYKNYKIFAKKSDGDMPIVINNASQVSKIQ